MNGTLQQYVRYVVAAAPARLAWAIVLILAYSLAEGFGVAMLLPILRLAGLELGAGDARRAPRTGP